MSQISLSIYPGQLEMESLVVLFAKSIKNGVVCTSVSDQIQNLCSTAFITSRKLLAVFYYLEVSKS